MTLALTLAKPPHVFVAKPERKSKYFTICSPLCQGKIAAFLAVADPARGRPIEHRFPSAGIFFTDRLKRFVPLGHIVSSASRKRFSHAPPSVRQNDRPCGHKEADRKSTRLTSSHIPLSRM